MRRPKVPALEIRRHLKTQKKNRQTQEHLDTEIEPAADGRVLDFPDAVGLDVGVSVHPAGGDAAADCGCEAQHCGADGGEAAGGSVGFEEEDPSELLGVFATDPTRRLGDEEVFVGGAFELDHGPVGVLHLDDDGCPAVGVFSIIPPAERGRHFYGCEFFWVSDLTKPSSEATQNEPKRFLFCNLFDFSG